MSKEKPQNGHLLLKNHPRTENRKRGLKILLTCCVLFSLRCLIELLCRVNSTNFIESKHIALNKTL